MFPKKNILAVLFDELKADPSKLAKRLYSFVGVDRQFTPSTVNMKIHPAVEPRSDTFAHLVYKAACFTRERGFLNFLGRTKRNMLLNRILYKKVREKPEVPHRLKVKLRNHFTHDYKKLSDLIERPLPDSWFSEG